MKGKAGIRSGFRLCLVHDLRCLSLATPTEADVEALKKSVMWELEFVRDLANSYEEDNDVCI